MKNIQIENFNNLCRFCLEDNILLISIFNNDLIKERPAESKENLLNKYNKNNYDDYKFGLGSITTITSTTVEMIELCTGITVIDTLFK